MKTLVTSVFGFSAYTGILAALNPVIIALIILLTVLTQFMLRFGTKYERSRKDETAGLGRKFGYISSATANLD